MHRLRQILAAMLLGCHAAYVLAAEQPRPSGSDAPAQSSLADMALVCVDDDAIGYATFQSHNQKVLANSHGIFLTHLRRRNEAYTQQTWRLSRSVDGGETFETIFEDTHATNPPVIETDDQGNLYLVRVDFQSGDALLYRFLAENRFKTPIITKIPGAAAGKYSLMLDPQRKRLFFFAHNNTFHVIRLDGTVEQQIRLLRSGPNAVLQYPLLSLDDSGALHAAWTTQKHGEYLYWDIHHLLTNDGGNTWRNLDGKDVALPVVADDTGAALQISAADELAAHTWLSSILSRGAKCHFLYLAQTKPPRQHYLRYDIPSGQRDVHIQPHFRGESIELRGLDGYFIADRRDPRRIYCVGHDNGHLACLVSRDSGASWHDHARSTENFSLYSVGGFRWTTEDGALIGTFTDQTGSNLKNDHNSKVYFFKVPGADD